MILAYHFFCSGKEFRCLTSANRRLIAKLRLLLDSVMFSFKGKGVVTHSFSKWIDWVYLTLNAHVHSSSTPSFVAIHKLSSSSIVLIISDSDLEPETMVLHKRTYGPE